MARLILFLWDRWFGEALRKVEAESLAYRQSADGRRVDWKTVTVLLTAAVCLTVQNYASHPGRVTPVAGFAAGLVGGPDARRAIEARLSAWGSDQLTSLTWWTAAAVATYTVIPVLVIKLAFRERLSDYGTKVRGVFNSWPVYAVFVMVMVPLVWAFSAESRFQGTYPFYRVHSREQVTADLLRWEVLYAVQFVALEFFFRGFLVHGLKHRFGVYAVFVMTVPYCMIHFGKPMPEATASIIAGVALGLVSLATRSVWLGAALHISVAWGMDFATLARRGLLS
jgi:membrane protease YdiL (CAAX protease family)